MSVLQVRIALISSDKGPVPAIRGGSIQILIDGIKDFLAQHIKLTVYSIADPSLPEQETQEGIQYLRFKKDSYWAGIITDLQRQPGEFDLIHIFNRPRYVLPIKEASPDSRIILSLHNKMMRAGLMKRSEAMAVIDVSDRILAISNYIASTLIRRFGEAAPKVRLWYSGVAMAQWPPVWSPEGKEIRETWRREHGFAGKKVLLFTGRILRKKGVHVLIEAFRLLAQDITDLILVIVGDYEHAHSGYWQYLHQLSQPVYDRIIFTGFVPPDKIHGYYLAADIFICPSQWPEPLGRVHYEAMAAGTPIITMNRGGIPEVIQDQINGIVISDYRNPAALARAIKDLLAHPQEARAMAERGRQIVEEKFSFERVAAEILRHYQEVLAYN